jgi:hypothetical protein
MLDPGLPLRFSRDGNLTTRNQLLKRRNDRAGGSKADHRMFFFEDGCEFLCLTQAAPGPHTAIFVTLSARHCSRNPDSLSGFEIGSFRITIGT